MGTRYCKGPQSLEAESQRVKHAYHLSPLSRVRAHGCFRHGNRDLRGSSIYLKVICSTMEAEHAMKGSFQDAEAIEFIYTFE